MGLRAAAPRRRSWGHRARLSPRDAAAARAGFPFNSNGRLEQALPAGCRAQGQSIRLARSRAARRSRARDRREPQPRARHRLADRAGRSIPRRDRARRAPQRRRLRRAHRASLGVSAQPSPVSWRPAASAEAARRAARGLRHGRGPRRARLLVLRLRSRRRHCARHQAFPDHEFNARRLRRACRNQHRRQYLGRRKISRRAREAR